MIYFSSQPSSRRAFTLVETLVAVSILLLIVVGPLTITARTTKSASYAAEQVVAYFLAQEGLEIAQRARDEEILKHFDDPSAFPDPWGRFTNTASGGKYRHCFAVGGCGLTVDQMIGTVGDVQVRDCSSAIGCRLIRPNLPASGIQGRTHYRHGATSASDVATPYTRVIRFEHTGTDNWVRVTSEVTWRTGTLLSSQRVRMETYLLNVYGI